MSQKSHLQSSGLHGLLKEGHTILGKGGMAIVLLHMGSALLVNIKILVVATIMQAIEGQEYVRTHGIDLVPLKEVVVESTPSLAPILLLGSKLLDVLPRA
jgi:hypothetical protein